MAKKISQYSRKHPFAQVPWELMNSAAFRELPATAGKLLPVFLGKPRVPPQAAQYYLAEFEFTYSEAERLGVTRSTFAHVLKDLVRYGFIDPVALGGLRGCSHTSSKFRLSDRWKQYKTGAFKVVDWDSFGQERIHRQVHFSSAISPKNRLESGV